MESLVERPVGIVESDGKVNDNGSPTQPKNEPNLTGSCPSGVEKELDNLGIMSDKDDFDDPAFLFIDDDQLLYFGCGWRVMSHDAGEPQMHQIWVAKSDCKKSDFIQFLKKIGCEKRFVACSVESPHAFFAELTEDEAAKLEGVEGILNVSSLLWRITCD